MNTQLELIRETGQDDDETNQTYIIRKEDHTLGNALRYVIMKNPKVMHCSYTTPHPLEDLIHLRIQTYDTPASKALEKGLKDLHDLCGHILETFKVAVDEFREESHKT